MKVKEMKYNEYIKKYPQMKGSVAKCPYCGGIATPCYCGCGMFKCRDYCFG